MGTRKKWGNPYSEIPHFSVMYFLNKFAISVIHASVSLVPLVNHLGNNMGYCQYNNDYSKFHRLILQICREVL